MIKRLFAASIGTLVLASGLLVSSPAEACGSRRDRGHRTEHPRHERDRGHQHRRGHDRAEGRHDRQAANRNRGSRNRHGRGHHERHYG